MSAAAPAAAPTREQDQLVRDNVGFARGLAWQFIKGRHVPYSEREDIEGYAYEGLVDAARRFTPGRSKFRTYAAWRVRGAIIDGLRNSWWFGNPPEPGHDEHPLGSLLARQCAPPGPRHRSAHDLPRPAVRGGRQPGDCPEAQLGPRGPGPGVGPAQRARATRASALLLGGADAQVDR